MKTQYGRVCSAHIFYAMSYDNPMAVATMCVT